MIINAKGTMDYDKLQLIIEETFQPHTEQEHEYLKVILEGQLNERTDDVLVVTRTVAIPADAQDRVKLAMLNKERVAKGQPPLDKLPEDEQAKAVAAGAGGDDEEETTSTRRHYGKSKH